MTDPIKYYHLETFLLQDVRQRFERDHSIGAFDFFSIIIRKSNRSKTKVANRLLTNSKNLNLEQISRKISADIAQAKTEKEKIRVLFVHWEFKLAIASAILTIFISKYLRFTIIGLLER